jgi:hypothetical protein
MADVKQYVHKYVTGIIVIIVSATLVGGTLIPQIANITNVPLLTVGLMGIIAGAGILLLGLDVFF